MYMYENPTIIYETKKKGIDQFLMNFIDKYAKKMQAFRKKQRSKVRAMKLPKV